MEFLLPIENKDKLIEYITSEALCYYQIMTFTKGIFTNVPQNLDDIKCEMKTIYKGTYAYFMMEDFNERLSTIMKEKIRKQLTDFYISKTFDGPNTYIPYEWNIRNITEENNIIRIETYLLKRKYDISYIDPKFYEPGCLEYHSYPLSFIEEYGDKEAYLKDEICYVYVLDSVSDQDNISQVKYDNITNFVKSLQS